jgi:Lysyl oxidase
MAMAGHRFGIAVMGVAALLGFAAPVAAQVAACAVPVGPKLPDLIMDQQLLASQLFASEESFSPKSCTVVEGVISKPGKQTVLRFNSSTPNVGQADMYIGDPALCPDLFEFSDCHQHLHFKNYTAYRLWTMVGYNVWVTQRDVAAPADSGFNAQLLDQATTSGDLVSGHKQGFCMMDSAKYLAGAGPAQYLSCTSNQGLSVGWEDIYGTGLPDQFIALTGLAEGDYVLENQVNPSHTMPESDYTNNFAAVKFHYTPKKGNTPANVVVIQ